MSEPITLFITEGPDDKKLTDKMCRVFLHENRHVNTVVLPAQCNIYMLYQKLENDDLNTDTVSLLREMINDAHDQKSIEVLNGIKGQAIDQIYMLFDLDSHEKNLPVGVNRNTVLMKMLERFSNETEFGKLYINYPMVEAVYDYMDDGCQAFTGCYCKPEIQIKYKQSVHNRNASRHYIKREEWERVIDVFYLRLCCLFDKRLTFDGFRGEVSPLLIYDRVNQIYRITGNVFVLSCFPEILLDYYGKKFWNEMVHEERTVGQCICKLKV